MRLYQKSNRGILKGLGAVLAFLCAAVLLTVGAEAGGRYAFTQTRESTNQALRKALVSCYALEGMYPSDISYLEDHYGLLIDHDRFTVDYNAFADNVMPSFQVVEKGQWTLEDRDGIQ